MFVAVSCDSSPSLIVLTSRLYVTTYVVRAEVSQPACASAHFFALIFELYQFLRATMKKILPFLLLGIVACGDQNTTVEQERKSVYSSEAFDKADALDGFEYQTDQFADVRIVRYQIPGFDKLSLQEKKLCYFLVESGLYGRDIMYSMNHKHNLAIRKALETIVEYYDGERSGQDWDNFMTYAKRFWFSNGIHHHYSYKKFIPEFSQDYFAGLLSSVGHQLNDDVLKTMFDPTVAKKKVSKEKDVDLIEASCVNFYGEGLTQSEVKDYYANLAAGAGEEAVSFGLNTKLVKENGTLKELVYKIGGLYGESLEKINEQLALAKEHAENEHQAKGFDLLMEYFRTGDLKVWDDYNVAWVTDTVSDVDYIHGFVEVYNDPIGYKGSFETIVEVKDPEASANMRVVQENAQWFEDNSPIMDEHKKKDVVGITYNFINVVGESGDASPSTPIGVNLPNALWIRKNHGSKSVSLGNIVGAYDKASGSGSLEEFCHDEEELNRVKKYGDLAGKLHTALHEVIGHASGQLNPGVGTPKETLQNYKSTIEEGRADLVALYFILDPKMQELGLVPSVEVGKAEYDSYIRNGLMYQLRRIEPGEVIEEDHMRNRQMVAAWVFEKGQKDKVISKVIRDGKTYFEINDYDQLRELFGQLLRELQRVTSEGDFEGAKALVEDYGVQVDPELHAEVLKRSEKLKTAPYGGFINPRLVPVTNDAGEIMDVVVEYPQDFVQQMLDYGKKYATLPVE